MLQALLVLARDAMHVIIVGGVLLPAVAAGWVETPGEVWDGAEKVACEESLVGEEGFVRGGTMNVIVGQDLWAFGTFEVVGTL